MKPCMFCLMLVFDRFHLEEMFRFNVGAQVKECLVEDHTLEHNTNNPHF